MKKIGCALLICAAMWGCKKSDVAPDKTEQYLIGDWHVAKNKHVNQMYYSWFVPYTFSFLPKGDFVLSSAQDTAKGTWAIGSTEMQNKIYLQVEAKDSIAVSLNGEWKLLEISPSQMVISSLDSDRSLNLEK